jgi:hypothetical protein
MEKTIVAAAICQVLVSNFSGTSYTIGGCRVLSAREHESDEPQSFLLPEPEAQAMAEYLGNENPHIQVEIRPFLRESGSDGEDADGPNAELINAAQTASSLTEEDVTDPAPAGASDAQTEQPTVTVDAATEQKTDAAQEPAPKTGRQKAQKP